MLLIDVIWGFNLVASKVGVTGLPPILFTALRFLLLFVLLAPFLRVHHGQMRLVILVALTLGFLHFGLLFSGLALADDVSPVAIAIQLGVPFAALASVLLLGEQVGPRRWLGIALAFVGVLVVGFDPIVFDYAGGLVLVVLAAAAFGLGVTFAKRLSSINVFQQQAWVAAVSWPLLLTLSLLLETEHGARIQEAGSLTWAALAYTAIFASLIGHGGVYFLVQRYDVSHVAPMTLLAPILSIGFAVALLDDALTWRMVAGGLVTLIGVFIVAREPGVMRSTQRVVSGQ